MGAAYQVFTEPAKSRIDYMLLERVSEAFNIRLLACLYKICTTMCLFVMHAVLLRPGVQQSTTHDVEGRFKILREASAHRLPLHVHT